MFKKICATYFDFLGWSFKNELPKEVKKFVVIGCPHTSNWDFWLAMVFFHKSGIKGKFTIKKEWLRFPLKGLFKKLGAIGIDRQHIESSGHKNLTDHMASVISLSEQFALLVTPEGTRKPNDKWKTGFYYIALKAKVPIALAYGDYEKKTMGIGKVLYPGNFEEDMRDIMSFYKTVTPRRPENFLLDSRFQP